MYALTKVYRNRSALSKPSCENSILRQSSKWKAGIYSGTNPCYRWYYSHAPIRSACNCRYWHLAIELFRNSFHGSHLEAHFKLNPDICVIRNQKARLLFTITVFDFLVRYITAEIIAFQVIFFMVPLPGMIFFFAIVFFNITKKTS